MLQTAIPYLSNFARSERFQKRCQKWHFWTEIRSTPKSFFCAFQDSAGTRESKKYHFIEIPDKKIFLKNLNFSTGPDLQKLADFDHFGNPNFEASARPNHMR